MADGDDRGHTPFLVIMHIFGKRIVMSEPELPLKHTTIRICMSKRTGSSTKTESVAMITIITLTSI